MVKMTWWRPWPPLIWRKYEVRLTVHQMKGCDWMHGDAEEANDGLSVEIRWKGSKILMGSFRRRTVMRNFTREENAKRVDDRPNDGVLVKWDEEFHSVCCLSGYRDGIFLPWEINFTVFHRSNKDLKSYLSVVGSATLNIAEYSSNTEQQLVEIKIPSTISGVSIEYCPVLNISIALLELRDTQQPTDSVPSAVMQAPSPPESGHTSSSYKEEFSSLKAGFWKVKSFTKYVSARRSKRACHEDLVEPGCSFRSDDPGYDFPCDSDSQDEFEEYDETDQGSSIRKSLTYEALPCTNHIGALSNPGAHGITNKDESLIYYSNRPRPDTANFAVEKPAYKVHEKSLLQNYTHILPWRKRKLSFKAKSEPLLKKAYGEEGGDDIDFDRRQLNWDESLSYRKHLMDEDTNSNQRSEFWGDSFAVGMWERKEITSRDGQMKIKPEIFFASIDQRSEQAAGEGACTALVAVIAYWLQNNHNLMPVKSQFDSLIREGSLEWRKLCENHTYQEQFPDKHFDLETVIQAKVRDLCVVPEHSFIGFFHSYVSEGGTFDLLNGAMSFDSIWEEISHASGGGAQVFIISWNDHFFVLKVEHDAYYIIDTLGERLHEGCNQAYILKFDENTAIYSLQSKDSEKGTSVTQAGEPSENEKEQKVVCQGKECCREYMKNFLAAVPIRELQSDIKKGRAMLTPLHHRLQIEFHYTKLQQPMPNTLAVAVHSLQEADDG